MGINFEGGRDFRTHRSEGVGLALEKPSSLNAFLGKRLRGLVVHVRGKGSIFRLQIDLAEVGILGVEIKGTLNGARLQLGIDIMEKI